MQLEAMLEKCRREQWHVDDLDWSGKPRPMSESDEIAIVQYFTDMAGIERLAKELFVEQRRRATDPTLKKIFSTFVVDEERHAVAAERLARFYDVRKLKTYSTTDALARFVPHFVHAVRFLSAEIANMYITGGELILDVALLRSINDHVKDDMSSRAMELINRDESRHIAIDFHMLEHYGSEKYEKEELGREAKQPPLERVRAAWALAGVVYFAAPFFRGVFFEPMKVVDPTGKRIREAFKRMQMVAAKPTARRSKFVSLLMWLQDVYNDHPRIRARFGGLIARVVGVEAELLDRLLTEADRERAARMTFAEMAEEALAAKYVPDAA